MRMWSERPSPADPGSCLLKGWRAQAPPVPQLGALCSQETVRAHAMAFRKDWPRPLPRTLGAEAWVSA